MLDTTLTVPLTPQLRMGEGNTLRPGQSWTVPVREDASGLFLQLGAARVRLPVTPALRAGEMVRLEIRPGEGRLIVSLNGTASGGGQASASPTTDVAALGHAIGQALAALRLTGSAESLAPLFPSALPLSPENAGALLARYVGEQGLGSNLSALLGMLREAASAGALSPERLATWQGLVAGLSGAGAAEMAEQLRYWLRASRPTEARLASALRACDLARRIMAERAELRAALAELARAPGFPAWLRAASAEGGTSPEEAVLRALRALSGNQSPKEDAVGENAFPAARDDATAAALRDLASMLEAAARAAEPEQTGADALARLLVRLGASEAALGRLLGALGIFRWHDTSSPETPGALPANVLEMLARGDLGALLDGGVADLAALVAHLREDTALGAYLRSAGRREEFLRVVQRLEEGLAGSALQQLRGLQQPYWCFEVPLSPTDALRRLVVHLFGERGPAGGHRGAPETTVVLDLATQRLGALWVLIGAQEGTCRCLFRVAEPAAEATIRAASGRLAQGLAEAGFTESVIEVEPWDGDRLRAAAGSMAQLGGVDVTT